MRGGAPLNQFKPFFGTLSHLMDVINCAKFNIDRSRGFGLGDVGKMHVFSESEAVLSTI